MEIKGPNNITAPTAVNPGVTVTAASTSLGPQTNPPAANTVQLSGLLTLLQKGQQLEVLVIALEGNRLLLQLKDPLVDAQGNRTWVQFRAPINIPAQVGQQLRVEVVEANPAQPVLKLIAAPAAITVQTALHAAISKQQIPSQFYANITQLNQPSAGKLLQDLPVLIREQIQTLWRQLPEQTQLHSAPAIKQALRYSGVFLEANLLRSVEPEPTLPVLDVRSTLLRLAAALRQHVSQDLSNSEHQANASSGNKTEPGQPSSAKPATAIIAAPTDPQQSNAKELNNKPPHPHVPQAYARQVATLPLMNTREGFLEQLLQQTERTLAHVQTLQLHTANNETLRPSWAMELPVRHGDGVDLFDLRVQPDANQSDNGEANAGWTVMLAFDLDGLGPLRVQVSLVNNTISTFWWAEQAPTVTLFHQHMDTLKARLAVSGLTIDQIRCQAGLTTHEISNKSMPYNNVTIDELI